MSVKFSADASDAFSHLLMVGLASILEDDDTARCCRFRWLDTLRAFEFETSDELNIDQMAAIISEHAKRWAQSLPLNSEDDYTIVSESNTSGKTLHATMSPRLSGLSVPCGWRKLQKDREAAIDSMRTFGDYRYFGALGQPSYWSGEQSHKLRSDFGASRWEMVTRNRGQEFIGGRLLPLSQCVAARSVENIRDGLLGTKIEDEIGNNKSTSRAATGLHAPAKTDNARAWCALMGVAAFPTRVTTRGDDMARDSSAALFQIKGPVRFAILPLFDQYWTTAEYRSVVRSEALARFGIQKILSTDTEMQLVDVSSDWLEEKGVAACCIFNQFVSDNASAPERWLEQGEIIPVQVLE